MTILNRPRSGLAVGLSFAVHLGAAYCTAHVLPPRPASRPAVVEMMTVVAPNQPQPVARQTPLPPPIPTPTEAARTEPSRVARTTTPSPAPTPVAAQPAAEPVDLTGTTLVAGDGASWSTSAIGNGQSSNGPIRVTSRPAVEEPKPVMAKVRIAPRFDTPVPLERLSRQPVPPPLDGRLLANYPPSAKQRGQSGEALVLARIDPDGQVREATVASESAASFGDACQHTVLGSRWQAPLDETGRAVATLVRYRCRFEVSR